MTRTSPWLSVGASLVAALLSLPAGAEAGEGPRLHTGKAAASQPRARTTVVTAAATVENGLSCTNIDFEGIGNLSPVPEFDGISSPDWLGIIDQDAGGTGNFAFEPSPQTIAFWLGGADGTGSSRDVVFSEPAAVVELFYASSVPTTMEAFDDQGRLITTVSGGANVNRGPGGDPTGEYNRWDRLRLDGQENRIARIRVHGAINRTGIDDLKVCRRVGVDTVEFTQAIQQIQDLDELQSDLSGDGEPPVPLVRDKPAVMRVYFQEVQAVTNLEVEARFGGGADTRRVVVQPGCDRDEQRQRSGGCNSADFYFTPAADNVTVDLEISDAAGTQVETHRFQLRPRRTEPLVLGAVRVCDALNAQGVWQCADDYDQRLSALVQMLRKIAPTSSVRVVDTGETVRRAMDADGDGTVTLGDLSEEDAWWGGVAGEIDRLSSLFDDLRDFLGLQDRRYYGMTRGTLPGTILGIAADIPSRGALSRTSGSLLGQDASQVAVAHETFHTMGRRHTNTSVPAGSAAPGCGLAPDSSTDWPFPDNRLRSLPNSRLEVGFDVAARQPLPAQNVFDVMSYCAPMWISPHTYTRLLEEELTKSAAVERPKAVAAGSFWLIAGSIGPAGAKLDRLFEISAAGETGAGSGPYRIEVRNASGSALFTRRFTPSAPAAMVQPGGDDFVGEPIFSELVPVQAGAASVAVLDPAGKVVASRALSGAAPSVTVTFPRGGETLQGVQTVTWQVVDPDSSQHSFWVQYSARGGELGSWQTLGFVAGNRLAVNFDELPGTGSGGRSLVRVLASDGAKTGAAVSAAFTVPRKGPAVEIAFPRGGAVFQASETVWLQGSGFDAEDGALDGIAWRSDLDGALGTGPSLPVHLSPGAHRLTLTGTDGEGKTASREVQVIVAGAGPTLDLQAVPLDTLPTTCVEVTLAARSGSVPLRTAEYSLNGGANWTQVPLSRLPLRFIVPGRGFFHLVARTFDVSGQLAAEDARFFVESACQSAVPQPPAGEWMTTGELPGFRFKARITSGDTATTGAAEGNCIGETLCVSGAVPGRAELFARVIGPRTNGRLWVSLVRFTTAAVELWVEQSGSGQVNYYRLPGISRESSELTGMVDKEAFLPGEAPRREAAGLRARVPGDPGVELVPLGSPDLVESAGTAADGKAVVFTSPEFPGFRFRVRILSGDEEVAVRREADCLAETVCISGAVPGRSELFLRIIGPRPNGFLWVNLVRFTTSRVEVEVEQLRTGRRRSYVLSGIPRESSSLDGLVDKEAFVR